MLKVLEDDIYAKYEDKLDKYKKNLLAYQELLIRKDKEKEILLKQLGIEQGEITVSTDDALKEQVKVLFEKLQNIKN